MHERRRAEGRFAGQSRIHEHRAVGARDAVRRGQFHEQIVRVLAVDQRRDAVRGLAGLEQQRIALAPDGCRLEREHRTRAKSTGAERPRREPHEHVGAEDVVVAARSALVIGDQERGAMEHQRPLAAHRMDRVVRC